MARISQETTKYFRAYQDYFWRWTEQGNVIEFVNERTICYREDLSNILGALPNTTSLSLGSILLILCACKDNWETLFNARSVLMAIKPVAKEGAGDDYDIRLKQEAYDFLCMVNRLPAHERSDVNRTILLQCIFDALATKGYHMGLLPILKEFNSGTADEEIFGTTFPLEHAVLIQDFAPLAAALTVFKDTESLQMKLSTGVVTVPKPLELPKPDLPPENLIDELQRHEETQNIAGLARRMMAALYIPMHLDGADEQNLGGISDITTKGTYDRLLLSELANDELLLSARLANNEALFLQKESAPKHKTQELGLIVDSTLKMWGAARLYAVAACIAFNESKRNHQQLKVWSLGGKHVSAQELHTKKDVVTLLEKMDTALHCGEMLLKTIQEHATNNGQYILITSSHFLNDPKNISYFHKVRDRLQYLITISSAGDIQMTQFHKNRSKLIHEVKIDLDGLLYSRRSPKLSIDQKDLPAILYEETFPMYFPTSKVRHKETYLYRLKDRSVVCVSIDNRLLYWPSSETGAVELITEVPKGRYRFGETEYSLYLMVIPEAGKMVKIYTINPATGVFYLTEVTLSYKTVSDFNFASPYFYFTSQGKLVAIDAGKGAIVPEEEIKKIDLLNLPHDISGGSYQIKKHLNNGYSPINSNKLIYINPTGKILSDKKELVLAGNELRWQENEKEAVRWINPVSQKILTVNHLPNIKFTKYTWRNGSTAIMDSRGLLHLKSCKSTIPEISVVMIVDQPTAAWSADGYVSGSKYFTGHAVVNYISASQFYQKYIQTFIDSLS